MFSFDKVSAVTLGHVARLGLAGARDAVTRRRRAGRRRRPRAAPARARRRRAGGRRARARGTAARAAPRRTGTRGPAHPPARPAAAPAPTRGSARPTPPSRTRAALRGINDIVKHRNGVETSLTLSHDSTLLNSISIIRLYNFTLKT